VRIVNRVIKWIVLRLIKMAPDHRFLDPHGAEAVATGAGRARTESGKGKAQKVSWKKQARSKEVAYPVDLVKFTSRKPEGSLSFRAGLRGEMVFVRVGCVADSPKWTDALT
jgi:hypothetical protein